MSAHQPIPEIAEFYARMRKYRELLMQSALWYASKGYPVFPAGPDKKPYTMWGRGEAAEEDIQKRPASCDLDTVLQWWERWPLAMIGMPTGQPSGLVVLDVDRKNDVDGLDSLKAVGIDPYRLTSLVAQTPSGGLHFYFAQPDDRYIKTSVGDWPGVDVRGQGGYVVIPPSIPHLDGAAYKWVSGEDLL
jgi:hypothetical protein